MPRNRTIDCAAANGTMTHRYFSTICAILIGFWSSQVMAEATASPDPLSPPTYAASPPNNQAEVRAPDSSANSVLVADASKQGNPSPDRVGQMSFIHPTIGILVGSSLHIKGLNYGTGIGVRGGVTLGRLYLGGLIAAHEGDKLSINYGAASAIGVTGGRQKYESSPLLVVADVGYVFEIGKGELVFRAMPNLGAGVLSIPIHSKGVYGESTIRPLKGIIGIGLSVGALVHNHLFVGAHARAYNTGDTSFKFGDLSKGTYQHGFSTSIFYDALFGEVAYFW